MSDKIFSQVDGRTLRQHGGMEREWALEENRPIVKSWLFCSFNCVALKKELNFSEAILSSVKQW